MTKALSYREWWFNIKGTALMKVNIIMFMNFVALSCIWLVAWNQETWQTPFEERKERGSYDHVLNGIDSVAGCNWQKEHHLADLHEKRHILYGYSISSGFGQTMEVPMVMLQLVLDEKACPRIHKNNTTNRRLCWINDFWWKMSGWWYRMMTKHAIG